MFEKLKVGDKVKVIITDFSLDSNKYVGKEGVVFKIQEEGLEVGETPDDPGIWVDFGGDPKESFFWQEELEKTGTGLNMNAQLALIVHETRTLE